MQGKPIRDSGFENPTSNLSDYKTFNFGCTRTSRLLCKVISGGVKIMFFCLQHGLLQDDNNKGGMHGALHKPRTFPQRLTNSRIGCQWWVQAPTTCDYYDLILMDHETHFARS